MTYAVILTGGVGSRFWPFSRELEPKQFIKIAQVTFKENQADIILLHHVLEHIDTDGKC